MNLTGLAYQDEPDLKIDGVGYMEKFPSRDIRFSKTLAALSYMNGFKDPMFKSVDMPPYNLIDEFTLIQRKESKLTRKQREFIIAQFNRTYEKK